MQAAAESLTSAKETDVLNEATAATDESESSTQTVQEPAEGGAMKWHDAEEPGQPDVLPTGHPDECLARSAFTRPPTQTRTTPPTKCRRNRQCTSGRPPVNSAADYMTAIR
ncbi:hypothetical protein MRX96_018760 [Rhipicephalus microplus]